MGSVRLSILTVGVCGCVVIGWVRIGKVCGHIMRVKILNARNMDIDFSIKEYNF